MAYIRLVAVRKKILPTRVFEFESAPVYINFIL